MKPIRSRWVTSALSFVALAAPDFVTAQSLKRWAKPDASGTAWAVKIDDGALAFTSMLLPWDKAGMIRGDARMQVVQTFANVEKTLAAVGSSKADVARLYVYVSNDNVSAEVDAYLAKAFSAHPPAVTLMRTPLPPGAAVGVEAIAAVKHDGGAVRRLSVAGLPPPSLGPHLAVMPKGQKLFFSGQIEPRNFVRKPEDPGAGFRETLANLGRGLEHYRLGKSAVVQIKAFVWPYTDRPALEAEIARFFSGGPIPPLVVAQGRAVPSAEIEFTIAGKEIPVSPGPIAYGPLPGEPGSPRYSAACVVDAGVPLIFIAGLHGETAGGTCRDEVREIFARLAAILFETGGSFRHLVKSIGHYQDPEGQRALRDIRGVYYDPARPPTSSVFQTAGVGRAGKTITKDMIAVPAPE